MNEVANWDWRNSFIVVSNEQYNEYVSRMIPAATYRNESLWQKGIDNRLWKGVPVVARREAHKLHRYNSDNIILHDDGTWEYQ